MGLYTSLNGGNPSNKDRIADSLSLNAKELLASEETIPLPEKKIFKATKKALDQFSLVAEVKNLSQKCVRKQDGKFLMYTVDRGKPYETQVQHKGISRVLQGFEVVLLSVLIKECFRLGLIPVSLDHDGFLAIPSKKPLYKGGGNIYDTLSQFKDLPPEEKASMSANLICQKINQSSFKDWAVYLLDEGVPVEPKRFVMDGKNFEF